MICAVEKVQLLISPGCNAPRQIGLARLITDEVSFAYLTDVYVLEDFQGKGLGRWMIECLNESLDSWPHLRRSMLVTSHRGPDFYKKIMGMNVVAAAGDASKPDTVVVMTKTGLGSVVPA